MACPSFVIVACIVAPHIVSGVGHAVTGDFLGALASGIQDAVSWIFTNTATWWLRIPSPDLANEPAITAMRQWLLPITAAVAAGGMIAAGIRTVLTRRANPLLDVGTGLAAIAAAATLGVAVPNLLLQAGDSWSSWVLDVSTGGQFSARLNDILSQSGAPDVIVIIFGMLALVMGALQAALLVFRQAAVIILAAMLPLAAAGATAPLTRAWIRKIVSWMLALIAYKPAAAAVYAAAFTMIGKGANLQTLLMGFVMLALSLLAMPVLMRFFTWTTGAVASTSGGSLLGAAVAGGAAAGALRSPSGGAQSTPASDHASYLASQQQVPPSAQADGAAAGSGTGSPAARAPGSGQQSGGGGAANGNGAAGAASSDGAASTGSAASAAAAGTAGARAAGISGAGAAGSAGPAGTGAGMAGAGAAASGAATAATGGLAAVFTAAAQAAKGLADGARDTAAQATGDGEQQ